MKKKIKIYELTTNEKDGYLKYNVRGIKNEAQAIKLAKYVFGEYAWIPGGISWLGNQEESYGGRKIGSITIKSFKKWKSHYNPTSKHKNSSVGMRFATEKELVDYMNGR